MSDPIVDLLAEEWASIQALIADLDEEDFRTPTALPGWSVQDNVAHVIGTELMLSGEPAPDVAVDHLTHLTGPFPTAMETWVEARRSRSGAEVRAELDQVVERRLAALRAMTDDEMEAPSWSPIGEVPYRVFMAVRVFDCWMHEQDIRRALGRPGHLTGPVVDKAMERFQAALGMIVGKRAGAPEGSSVVFDLTGDGARRYAVVVTDGRARVVDEAPAAPTTTITLPFTSFVALGGGRWDVQEAEAAGDLSVEGDTGLGMAVLANLPFTP